MDYIQVERDVGLVRYYDKEICMLKIIFVVILAIILLFAVYIFSNRIYWKNTNSKKLLDNLDKKYEKSNKESIVLIEDLSGSKKHILANNIKPSEKIIIASITKLYTHSVIFAMSDRGLIDLNKVVTEYLPHEHWKNLHNYKGIDHSEKIRVIDLINQTSGLADYEMDIKGDDSVIDRFKKEDFILSETYAIRLTKSLEAKFLPGEDKAHYSNINAILLGLIAEQISGKLLIELYNEYIFIPLGLENTELASENNHILAYLGNEKVDRTKYISSALACGGLVSTVDDMMIFIKAFFKGKIFSKSNIENANFHKIQFFPIKYGGGMMAVELSTLMSPFFDAPMILGHSGLSGSFSYYCPEKELFIVGTLNKYEENPYKWIYQYINAMK